MKDSLHLLRDNFNKYYRNMTSSKGSSTSFLLDYLYDVYESVKNDHI